MVRLIIGLVIPFIAIDLMLPWANSVEFTIYDIPFVYIWMFSWFVLTSVCLMACWLLFDRKRHDGPVDTGHQI